MTATVSPAAEAMDRVIECPAPRRDLLAILIAAQGELLDHIEIGGGCGQPTPPAEQELVDQIAVLAKATTLASCFVGGRFEVPSNPMGASVETITPNELLQGVISGCDVLLRVGAALPTGFTRDQITSIRGRCADAIGRMDALVEATFGDGEMRA